MRHLLVLLVSLLLAPPIAAQHHSPYAPAARQEIKALSPAEIDDLRAGRGMGLAKAAELNGYPGPMHVLELSGQLSLTPAQHTASAAIMTRMREAATALGAEIIAAEGALDRAFAQSTITPDTLAEQAAAIAVLQSRLRSVHLNAHLQQRALLSAEQIRRYMELRGYAGAPPGHHK